MTELTGMVLGFITEKNNLSDESLKSIVESKHGTIEIQKLRNLIEALRANKIKVFYTKDSNEIKLRTGNIDGCLKIISGSTGKLDKLIIKPYVPEIESIDSLIDSLSLLGGLVDASGIYDGICIDENSGKKPMAVASLVKIIISAALCNEIRKENISLACKYTIQEEDISYLSTGLTLKDIGKEVSVKELLSLMLLASDNSAMDIVIKLIGISKIEKYVANFNQENKYHFSPEFKLTKKLYGKAWDIKDLDHYNPKEYVDSVKWNLGFDYFIPLDLINKISLDLNKFEWLPWDELPTAKVTIYKGGSAPGVLSAMWCTRESETDSILSFAINRTEPYTILEELYAYECARKILLKFKIL